MPGLAVAQYEWAVFGQLEVGRQSPEAQVISDNEVLVFGGYTSGGPTDRCEILNVETLEIYPAATMPTRRAAFASVRVGDRNVYAIGGWVSGSFEVTGKVDVYDARSDRWSASGALQLPRFQHTAALLDSTSVIVVGGRDKNSQALDNCEIFDLRTGQSRTVTPFPFAVSEAKANRLNDGRVVVYGGRSGGPGSFRSTIAYVYNAAQDRWEEYVTFQSAVYLPAQIVHSSGPMVIAGGSVEEYSDGRFSAISNVQRSDSTGQAVSLGVLIPPKIPQGLVELPNGEVLCIGGWLGTTGVTRTCEWIDLVEGTVRRGPDLNVARGGSACLLVKSGFVTRGSMVLSIGGRSSNGPSSTVEFLRIGCDPGKGDILQTQQHELVGNALRAGSEVQLTPPQEFSRGAVWAREKVNMRAPFSTMFAFKITQGDDQGEVEPVPSDPGADGVVLVIQNQGADVIGNYGRGIGYDGIKRSIAVEFDTYHNPPINDPNGNHVAIQSRGRAENTSMHGTGATLAFSSTVMPISADGTVYYAYVTYQQGRMDVYLNTSPSFRAPVVSKYVDLDSLIGLDPNGAAWVGITSGTGRSFEQHDLVMWEINGCAEDSPVSVQDGPEPVTGRVRDFAIVGDEVRLAAGAEGDRYVIDVIDVRGTVIWSTAANASVVALPSASIGNGWYLVRVSSSTGSSVQTWVVVR